MKVKKRFKLVMPSSSASKIHIVPSSKEAALDAEADEDDGMEEVQVDGVSLAEHRTEE